MSRQRVDHGITPSERERFVEKYVAEGLTRDQATRAERLLYNANACPDEVRGMRMFHRAIEYLYACLPERAVDRRAS